MIFEAIYWGVIGLTMVVAVAFVLFCFGRMAYFAWEALRRDE